MNDAGALARRLFGVDYRALAAFRVGLAGLVLVDCATRFSDLHAHYADAGILSRADVLRYFDFLHELPFCLHLIGGSTWLLSLLFAVHVLAALALLVGYRAGLAAIIVWVLTTSIQLRNLYIGGGFDALMRMMLFWSMFLPLGARYSIDARQSGRQPPGAPLLSVGGVALLTHVVIIYFAAGVAKGETSVWPDGAALEMILHNEFFVTGFGAWLAGFPGLCAWMTHAVLYAELASPLLILSGIWAPARVALAVCFLAMNVGFGLTLSVGTFPWLISVAVLAFLPPPVWDRVEAAVASIEPHGSLRGLVDRLTALPGPAGSPLSGPVGQVLCALSLAYVLMWNVGVARDQMYVGPAAVRWFGEALFLQQKWRMFAEPSTTTGWVEIPGRLVDGRPVNLLAAGGPVPGDDAIGVVDTEKPERISRQFKNGRWRTLIRRSLYQADPFEAPLQYGRYLCREWNRAHEGGDQLATFEIVGMFAPLTPPYVDRIYEKSVVWEHGCFR